MSKAETKITHRFSDNWKPLAPFVLPLRIHTHVLFIAPSLTLGYQQKRNIRFLSFSEKAHHPILDVCVYCQLQLKSSILQSTWKSVAIGQINMIRKVLQQRCDNRKTSTIKRYYKRREEDCSPTSIDSRFTGKSLTKEELPEKEPSALVVSP